MVVQVNRLKITLIVFLIAGILGLHYFTMREKMIHHAVYRMLFYLPLILSSFWFGLRGAIYVSASVFLLYLPYVIARWQGVYYEFNQVLEGMLFVFIAFVLGYLAEKERQKQRELIRNESLAAIGRALSEVAHDMKAPLVAIGGFAQQVCKRLEPDDVNRRKLNVVIQETARLESMVKGMLDFGRPVELKRSRTDLNQLVLETLEVAKVMADQSGVMLHVDLEPSLPSLPLDPPRIRQVILNLIANAVQASPGGGGVFVTTSNRREKVVIEVTDHGCGIPKENFETIFQPFVSNKKGGTGLGLAIVKKIVNAHGGEISFHLNAVKGVTFSAGFPIIALNPPDPPLFQFPSVNENVGSSP